LHRRPDEAGVVYNKGKHWNLDASIKTRMGTDWMRLRRKGVYRDRRNVGGTENGGDLIRLKGTVLGGVPRSVGEQDAEGSLEGE